MNNASELFATAIIADDEPLLRLHLNKALADIWPTLNIVAMAGDGTSALAEMMDKKPDILFLDIRMPGLDGVQVAQQLRAIETKESAYSPIIIFTTAYNEYAVSAFEHCALDYLLKPISDTRLAAACQRAKKQLAEKAKNGHSELGNMSQLMEQLANLTATKRVETLKWIKASKGEEIHLIAVKDVLYFKAEDKYVSLYCLADDDTEILSEYIIRTSLKDLIEQLDSELFWLIHRSTIVNVSAIDKVKKELTGKMFVLIQSRKLAVSRNAHGLFKGM